MCVIRVMMYPDYRQCIHSLQEHTLDKSMSNHVHIIYRSLYTTHCLYDLSYLFFLEVKVDQLNSMSQTNEIQSLL